MGDILHDHELEYLVARLKNQTESGEGTHIPPRLKAGTRIPLVTGLRVISQTTNRTGTKVVLAWNNVEETPDVRVREYSVYALGIYNGSQPYGPFSTLVSPIEIPLQLEAAKVVTFSVKTVLINGLSSDIEESPTCTASIPAFSGGHLLGVTVFNASGTWTRPAGCNSVVVKSKGGGGGGGGGKSTATYYRGGSGGAEGGYCEQRIDVSAYATFAVVVGLGGAGGGVDLNGAAGGNTTFGASHTAGGGGGGNSGLNSILAAPGGTATGGDINLPGAVTDYRNSDYIGGDTFVGHSGAGTGAGRGTAGVGGNGAANSGGGGAGGYSGPTAYAGGDGGSGFCIVYEYS